ncbi:MAG: nucleotide exchange factor GrpE [archaeon]|nr:nucleotide exchange factor GrpE [archaeon]
MADPKPPLANLKSSSPPETIESPTPPDSPKSSQSSQESPKSSLSSHDLLATLQRVQADFENYRKRMVREMAESQMQGKALAFRDLLSFADALDAAAQHASPDLLKGMESLRQQFLAILNHHGIRPILAKGKKFDPHFHECLQQGNDPQKEEGIVLEEYQKGYLFNDTVLRTAKVNVNTFTPDTQTTDPEIHNTTGGKNNE